MGDANAESQVGGERFNHALSEIEQIIERWDQRLTLNSLKLVKSPPAEHELNWVIDSGAGSFNAHVTFDKTELPSLHLDGSSLVGSSATTSLTNSLEPPVGTPAYYRVYGRGSCSGQSFP